MKEQTFQNPQQREKLKKFLLVLPLLILPFMTMAFWALGGGKGDLGQQTARSRGINTELPEANFKDAKPQDKLSLYDQVARDSASARNSKGNTAFSSFKPDTAAVKPTPVFTNSAADANEARIKQRLAALKQEINKTPEPVVASEPAKTDTKVQASSADIDRLEKLMQSMNSKNADDPEMKQLDRMMDKILDIQHPERVNEALKNSAQMVKADSAFKAIPAIIDGNQKVLQGGVVKLRLRDTIHIKGMIIPKDQLLFGSCNITNQRLLLDIRNIRLGTAIIPVNLTVFSLDGMAGINAPEAELAGAAGNGADNALQSMQFIPMDQTLATQAAGAGIETAKSLFSKKVKKIRVRLHGGETVLLRINRN